MKMAVKHAGVSIQLAFILTLCHSVEPIIVLDLVGWLYGLNDSWRQHSVSIGQSLREREKEKRNDGREKKFPNNPPPAPTASTVGPCPTLIQISRMPWHWKFTQHHRSTRPPPIVLENTMLVSFNIMFTSQDQKMQRKDKAYRTI